MSPVCPALNKPLRSLILNILFVKIITMDCKSTDAELENNSDDLKLRLLTVIRDEKVRVLDEVSQWVFANVSDDMPAKMSLMRLMMQMRYKESQVSV